jgi:hypothetical protein
MNDRKMEEGRKENGGKENELIITSSVLRFLFLVPVYSRAFFCPKFLC